MKDYDKALNILADAWELYEEIFGKQSEQVANCYLELALTHGKKKEYEDAINFQQKALEIFKSIEKFSNTEFLAQIAITLSEF